MSFEAQRYRQLRWGILAIGFMALGGLLLLTILQVRTIWPWLQPAILDCGCQLIQLELGPGTWVLTATLVTLTGWLWLRWLWALGQTVRRADRWRRDHQASGRWIHHPVLTRPYFLYQRQRPEAMTVGYLRPKIFLSQAMLQTLTGSELSAVLRHEQAHCRRRDPLWAALLESIGSAFGWPAWLRTWVNASYSLREISADAEATGNYQQTEAISGAVLKLLASGDVAPHPAFSPNNDRVEKLINPNWHPVHRLWHWRSSLTPLATLAAFVWLATMTITSAAELPKVPSGICQQQALMCSGGQNEQPTTVVCQELRGWQCIGLRGSFPISPYGATFLPR